MDQQLEEVEANYKKVTDLLRVQTIVKQLRQEHMDANVLQLIATTYNTIELLKDIAKDIDKLRNKRKLKTKDQNQLCTLEDIKGNLLKEIRDATKTLESKTNLMARQSVTLSVMKDLERATSIFKKLFSLKKSPNNL